MSITVIVNAISRIPRDLRTLAIVLGAVVGLWYGLGAPQIEAMHGEIDRIDGQLTRCLEDRSECDRFIRGLIEKAETAQSGSSAGEGLTTTQP